MLAIVNRGFLSAFLVGSKNNAELILSHLLFTNDNLIFCEANCKQLCHCVDSGFRKNLYFK
jgi:hypothetical protein